MTLAGRPPFPSEPVSEVVRRLEASGYHVERLTFDSGGVPIPNIPEMGRFFPAMDAALEAITNGRQSPKDALDGAAARMKTRQ